jgi:hypothetical protein
MLLSEQEFSAFTMFLCNIYVFEVTSIYFQFLQ